MIKLGDIYNFSTGFIYLYGDASTYFRYVTMHYSSKDNLCLTSTGPNYREVIGAGWLI